MCLNGCMALHRKPAFPPAVPGKAPGLDEHCRNETQRALLVELLAGWVTSRATKILSQLPPVTCSLLSCLRNLRHLP